MLAHDTPRSLLYLDVIPLRFADEAGGFSRAAVRRRGVAVAATLSSCGEFRHFDECRKVVEYLASAECVVGFNCLAFDYELIRGKAAFRRPPTIDLFQELSAAAGERVSLRDVATATFGRAGVADGNTLIKLFHLGEHERVLRACKRRLQLIRRLHEHIAATGSATITRRGQRRRVAVPVSTPNVIASGNHRGMPPLT